MTSVGFGPQSKETRKDNMSVELCTYVGNLRNAHKNLTWIQSSVCVCVGGGVDSGKICTCNCGMCSGLAFVFDTVKSWVYNIMMDLTLIALNMLVILQNLTLIPRHLWFSYDGSRIFS